MTHSEQRLSGPGGAGNTVIETQSAFLTAGGEMAALIAGKDWAVTHLGPREAWFQSLQTVLRILVTSRHAMWLGWGPQLTFFYNDAYSAMTLGAKHPWALGRPASEVWAEIWADIGPRAETVMRTGEATWDEGLLLFLERSGFSEETYHTFSYSPVPDDHGAIGGMLCVVTEDTERVVGERRMATLRDLAGGLAAVRAEPEVWAAIQRSLDANRHDLPFTATWLFDAEGKRARLSCVTGIERGHSIVPAEIDLAGLSAADPMARIFAGVPRVLIDDLAQHDALPTGAWNRPPRLAKPARLWDHRSHRAAVRPRAPARGAGLAGYRAHGAGKSRGDGVRGRSAALAAATGAHARPRHGDTGSGAAAGRRDGSERAHDAASHTAGGRQRGHARLHRSAAGRAVRDRGGGGRRGGAAGDSYAPSGPRVERRDDATAGRARFARRDPGGTRAARHAGHSAVRARR